MAKNPYSSFDIDAWYEESQAPSTVTDSGFDIDEWMRRASEDELERKKEEERLAQEKAEQEKQRKEALVTASKVNEDELAYDDVLDSLIQAESGGDANVVNDRNKNGTSDFGLTQINERWVNKGLTTSGLPSFQVNKNGDIDTVYSQVQEHMSSKVPNWNRMSDEFRREALLDEDNNIEVGRIIYENRGLGQWATEDKILAAYRSYVEY